ncbi:outer membrane lipoprotein-sorting protein [Natranaerofaba carboxydovora]|uniref:outer membrane lipoprotein-sorting protein n=1 Tax=Natranaerofaba carboxydovora TaxID=2742683 RepID=UPI001F12EB29|nr:DUF4367 domain-containing protein [Natranaerofaba carboxydovora]UMZ74888.1 hypothetical protein ACONDI_02492 [Natranaerofaba carboxydovora]
MISKRVLRLGLLIFLLLLVLVFNSCGSLDSDEIKARMEKKLDKLDSYKVQGSIVINDLKDEPSRSYNIEEWYLAPDNIKLEVFTDKEQDLGQVFVSKDDRLQIYNPLIEERVSYPMSFDRDMGNKFSFILYDKLNLMAAGEFEFEKEGDKYIITTYKKPLTHEMIVYKDRDGILGSEISIEKINMYRDNNTSEPYMTYHVDNITWNPEVDEEAFEVEEADEIEEVGDEISCNIEESKIEELSFDPVSIEDPSYDIFHLGMCEKRGQISIKYTSPNGNLSFTQKSQKSQESQEDINENDLANENITDDPIYINSDYENILIWESDGVKYTLVGDYSEKELVKLAEKTSDLEI